MKVQQKTTTRTNDAKVKRDARKRLLTILRHFEMLIAGGHTLRIANAMAQIDHYAVLVAGNQTAEAIGEPRWDDLPHVQQAQTAAKKRRGRFPSQGAYRAEIAPHVPCSKCGVSIKLNPARVGMSSCKGYVIPYTACAECSKAWAREFRRDEPTSVEEFLAQRKKNHERSEKTRRSYARHMKDRILPLAKAMMASAKAAAQ